MRVHAHEGDMRTKGTYARKNIHMKRHTGSDIHTKGHTHEGTCT